LSVAHLHMMLVEDNPPWRRPGQRQCGGCCCGRDTAASTAGRAARVAPGGCGAVPRLEKADHDWPCVAGAQVRMATFSQHHVDGLDLALSPLAYMLKCFPLTKDQEQRCAAAAAAPARQRLNSPVAVLVSQHLPDVLRARVGRAAPREGRRSQVLAPAAARAPARSRAAPLCPTLLCPSRARACAQRAPGLVRRGRRAGAAANVHAERGAEVARRVRARHLRAAAHPAAGRAQQPPGARGAALPGRCRACMRYGAPLCMTGGSQALPVCLVCSRALTPLACSAGPGCCGGPGAGGRPLPPPIAPRRHCMPGMCCGHACACEPGDGGS